MGPAVLPCGLSEGPSQSPGFAALNCPGDGTMSGVGPEVYTRLVADMLSLLVLPALEPGRPPVAGGFEALEGWGAEAATRASSPCRRRPSTASATALVASFEACPTCTHASCDAHYKCHYVPSKPF